MIVLAIDPGIRGCGVAAFEYDQLFWAAYVKNPAKSGNRADEATEMACAVATVAPRPVRDLAVEWPQIYQRSKGDPNDLLALCAVDAAIAAFVKPVTTTSYLPAEWKGQMKKEPCHARIRSRLSVSELRVLETVTGSTAHNVWDAVGIGLHHLGLFGKRRVV